MKKYYFLLTTVLITTGLIIISSFRPNSEPEILKMVNNIRANGCNCGNEYMPAVKPLRWNNRLAAAAKTQSDYMHRVRRMTHTGNRGNTAGNRINKTGYRYSYYAENIAIGQATAREVMSSWMSSPGHCKNIMSRYATEMGASKTGKYWVQVFTKPLK